MTARPVSIDQDFGGTNRARNLPEAVEPGDATPLEQVERLLAESGGPGDPGDLTTFLYLAASE